MKISIASQFKIYSMKIFPASQFKIYSMKFSGASESKKNRALEAKLKTVSLL